MMTRHGDHLLAVYGPWFAITGSTWCRWGLRLISTRSHVSRIAVYEDTRGYRRLAGQGAAWRAADWTITSASA